MYIPIKKQVKREVRFVQEWTPSNIEVLRGCFDSTDWNLFLTRSDLNKQVLTISKYMTFCVDSVMPTKKIALYPNNKPWVTKDLIKKYLYMYRELFTGLCIIHLMKVSSHFPLFVGFHNCL